MDLLIRMQRTRIAILWLVLSMALGACGERRTPPIPDQTPSHEPLGQSPSIESSESPATEVSVSAPSPIPISPLAASAQVVTLVDELEAATGGVTIDSSGNLYVADIGNVPSRRGNTVYKVTPEGEVRVFAQGEGLLGASGNAVDSLGNLFQANFTSSTIVKIAPDGMIHPFMLEGVRGPVGIAIDPEDNLYVANCSAAMITKITPIGESTELARGSPFNCPNGITLDDRGNLYVANFSDGWIIKVSPDGDAERFAELPGRNNGHLVFYEGTFYATARGAHQVFTISLQGKVSLLAGTGERGWDDGPALEATFSLPNGIAINANGTALLLNHVRQSAGGANHPTTVRMILLNGSD
jgi:sugar lactone lactonase YvrE